MEMRNLVVIFLLLDALVVLAIGLGTGLHVEEGAVHFHSDHGWHFFLVNAVRLGIMAAVVVLWRIGATRRVEDMLLSRRPSQQ